MKISLPPDFPTHSDQIKAKDYWRQKNRPDLTVKIQEIVSEFRSYHESHGTRFVSWSAGWKTWYTRVVRFIDPPKSKGVREPSKATAIAFRAEPVSESKVTTQMLHDLAEKLRSPTQKRLWS